jgi:RNA polymerase sigma factor (sigma-70 family)
VNADPAQATRQFLTTHWSVVLRAGETVSSERTAALETLCRAYWLPICAFARRKGWSEEDAKDLTQQFFVSLVGRNDFRGLDPQKGKFRTFLLAAFTHFLANEYDRANAQKRGGGRQILSLDQLPLEEMGEITPRDETPPETFFDVKWARAILRAALRRLDDEMREANKERQFEALRQFLTKNGGATEYEQAAKMIDVDASSTPVLVHRLRQRYRELVRQEVAQTVSSPTELDEEMRHLFATLNQ